MDLHIHTVLSPCTEIADNTPTRIVAVAAAKGLDLIGICDHNSARNTGATVRAAQGTSVRVLAGMEITSREEVHLLGLFPSHAAAGHVQDEVYARLHGENDEDAIGYQVVVDEFDQVEDLDNRLLIGATTLSADRVVALIRDVGGIAIASHVDREGFGIFGQLGFIPPGLHLDALEVSKAGDPEAVLARHPQAKEYVLVAGSDAHAPEEIGAAVTLAQMAEPSFDELRLALSGREGRSIVGLETVRSAG